MIWPAVRIPWSSRPKAVAALVVIAGLLSVAVAQLFRAPPENELLTAPVKRGTIEETVLANGILEPARMVNVGAQVNGQIRALHVVLGQRVKAGDLIAEIDSLPQANALRIAEAALANVAAQRKARAIQLREAEAVYRRQVSLINQKATSRQEFETAEAAYQTREAEVVALDAQITQAGVEVENARVNLGYTRIVAPIDGMVISVVTKQGQTLNSAQSVPTVVVLAQLDVMLMKVQISEADVSRVRPGQKVWFTVLGDRQTRHQTVLQQIEPAPASMSTAAEAGMQASANSQQTTTAVFYNGLLDVPNTDGRLRPQMTAQVNIILGSAENVPLIPWSSLSAREADGRYRVRVRAANGTILTRLVAIGLSDKVQAQVLDGLLPDDEVVINTDGALSDPGAMM